jgi:rod shape-determining protein MreD
MLAPFKRLELLLWNALPAIITLLLLMLVLAPKHVGVLGSVMPLLPLIPVYYWGLLHAREMPYWLVFTIGLVMDASTGLPLGLSSLLYMMFLALLRAQRKYIHKEGFVIKWAYFAMLLLTVCVLNWICVSLLDTMRDIMPALIQWFLTVCCYPLFHALFDAIYRGVNDRRWRLLHS